MSSKTTPQAPSAPAPLTQGSLRCGGIAQRQKPLWNHLLSRWFSLYNKHAGRSLNDRPAFLRIYGYIRVMSGGLLYGTSLPCRNLYLAKSAPVFSRAFSPQAFHRESAPRPQQSGGRGVPYNILQSAPRVCLLLLYLAEARGRRRCRFFHGTGSGFR